MFTMRLDYVHVIYQQFQTSVIQHNWEDLFDEKEEFSFSLVS